MKYIAIETVIIEFIKNIINRTSCNFKRTFTEDFDERTEFISFLIVTQVLFSFCMLKKYQQQLTLHLKGGGATVYFVRCKWLKKKQLKFQLLK